MPRFGNSPASLKRLTPYIFQFLRPYRTEIAQALFFLTLAAGAVLSVGFGVRSLVNAGFSGEEATLFQKGFIFLLSTSSILALAAYCRVSLTSWLAERVINDLRKTLFAHLMSLDPSYYDQARTGDLGARLNSDTMILLNTIATTLATTVRSLMQLFGAGLMLIVTSPKLTALVLLVIPFTLSPIGALGRRVRCLTKTVQEAQGGIEARIIDGLQALQTIQIFAQEAYVFNNFCTFLEKKMIHVKKRIHLRAFLVAAVIFLAFTSVGLVVWLGGQEVLAGRMSPGDLSAFLFFALIVAGSCNSLSELMGELQTAAGALERLVELIEVRPALKEPRAPLSLDPLTPGALTFKKVTFAYPTRPQIPVLKDISFTIKPGETLAIVGPSGAGKTTLFQLLLRFYDPLSGQILLGQTPLERLTIADQRRFFSVVPQEPILFNASLRDNILFGALEKESVSEHLLKRVIDQAALTPFIESLSDGLETLVGERGLRLSGGQKQRLAIARAFLKEAPFLLLDEATNALDSENEFHIQNALQALMSTRTTLVIAHRLSTVQRADQILVLDQGQIVEKGTHETLLAQQGLYFKLERYTHSL